VAFSVIEENDEQKTRLTRAHNTFFQPKPTSAALTPPKHRIPGCLPLVCLFLYFTEIELELSTCDKRTRRTTTSSSHHRRGAEFSANEEENIEEIQKKPTHY